MVGIGIIAGARKGQMAQNAMTVTNVLLGCVVIAGAALFYGFADSIASFVFAGLIAMLIRPDDEVYRVDAVWLGPQGLTLPWTARYSAYGIWVVLFVGVLLRRGGAAHAGERPAGVGARAHDPGHLRPDRRHRPRPPPGQLSGSCSAAELDGAASAGPGQAGAHRAPRRSD